MQGLPLPVECPQAASRPIELAFSADRQSVEITDRSSLPAKQSHFTNWPIHDPNSLLVGKWVSQEAYGTCTVSIDPYEKNPFVIDALNEILSMNSIPGHLEQIRRSADPASPETGQIIQQGIGVSFDRLSEQIILIFSDVRSYRFEGQVDEQAGTIVGTWNPGIGCGSTYRRTSTKTETAEPVPSGKK